MLAKYRKKKLLPAVSELKYAMEDSMLQVVQSTSKIRAAQAARLYFHFKPIISLFCGVIFAIAVVSS